jgi:hypothetical protein
LDQQTAEVSTAQQCPAPIATWLVIFCGLTPQHIHARVEEESELSGECDQHVWVLPSGNDVNVASNIEVRIAMCKELKILQDMLRNGLDIENLELGELYYSVMRSGIDSHESQLRSGQPVIPWNHQKSDQEKQHWSQPR